MLTAHAHVMYMSRLLMLNRNAAQAQQYCQRLLDLGGAEKEEAKALLRDIRSQYISR